jgi:branched-subunit amino acid aminotransferase/4-amino-4-deoxychorismate lyase
MNKPLGSWIDGVPEVTLPADDRGLHYGDGVFETLKGFSKQVLKALS